MVEREAGRAEAMETMDGKRKKKRRVWRSSKAQAIEAEGEVIRKVQCAGGRMKMEERGRGARLSFVG